MDATEHDVSNTFNEANEQTGRDGATLTYDAVGNLTDDGETYEYVYDAFGRLVQVKNQSSNLVSQHRYNGLGYRIAWQYDLDADGTVETSNSNHDPWLYQVHDSSWRVVAMVFAVDDGAGTEAGEYLAKADDDPRPTRILSVPRSGSERPGRRVGRFATQCIGTRWWYFDEWEHALRASNK